MLYSENRLQDYLDVYQAPSSYSPEIIKLPLLDHSICYPGNILRNKAASPAGLQSLPGAHIFNFRPILLQFVYYVNYDLKSKS